MPIAASMFVVAASAADENVARVKALAALSEMGTVDELTLTAREIRREGEINFGTLLEPRIISLADHDLVAFTFEAEVEPNEEQLIVLASSESS